MARTLETIRNARMYSLPVGDVTAVEDVAASVAVGVYNHGLIKSSSISFEQDKKVLLDTSDGTGGSFATHYRVTNMTGKIVLMEEIAINLQMAFRATATPGVAGTSVFNFLAASAFERRLVFVGISETNNSDTFYLDVFRAKFSPVSEFQLISDDFAETELSYDVLSNPNMTSLANKFAQLTSTKAP